ncbi:hypothetical protein BSL78_24874 [Apostichopus japonicus]|uniref:ZU5 domain-containing protein n=1 Tax=Stichopus japonicus TaxID=307972 RepID=A0A2G8JR99_STIJA|nr:hypothetical protein BSL78_24874 [Apostichopus japonicus]
MRSLLKSQLCNAPEQTLHHVLSSCQVSFHLVWRHDNILFALRDSTLKLGPAWDTQSTLFETGTLSYMTSTNTIPPDILPTTCRPDLTAIDRVQRKIHIMELTCPWDSAESFNNAQERKSDRYGPLIGDLSDIGWEVDFITVEIGVRGIIAPDNLPSNPLQMELWINKDGGVLELPDTGVSSKIPPGALEKDQLIQMRIIPYNFQGDSDLSFSSNSSIVVELLPSNLQLLKPVKLIATAWFSRKGVNGKQRYTVAIR